MRRAEIDKINSSARDYTDYQGYVVRKRRRTIVFEQHFVVPWELLDEDAKENTIKSSR